MSNGDSAFVTPNDVAETTVDKWPCRVPGCKAQIVPGKMREHICAHMLKGDKIKLRACGCCGGDGCTAKLKGNQPLFECQTGYFGPVVKWSQAPCFKDRAQCNNTPVECPDCKVVVWKYGMLEHLQQKHQGQPVPSNTK